MQENLNKECIFCKFILGEIPVHKIYEDENILAFLDNNPINPGHTLVIPKIHEPHFQNLNQETYTHLMNSVKKVANMVDKNLKPKRVGLMIAGWDVPHTHVHVIPMNDTHDIVSKRTVENIKINPTQEEFSSIANTIKA